MTTAVLLVAVISMWEGAAPDFRSEKSVSEVPGAVHAVVFDATAATGGYNHQPHITRFRSKFHAIWDNHRYGEDAPGQRILHAVSDDGLVWSRPDEIVPALVPELPFGGRGLFAYPLGFTEWKGRLFVRSALREIERWQNADRSVFSPVQTKECIYSVGHSCGTLYREIRADGSLGPLFTLEPKKLPKETLIYPVADGAKVLPGFKAPKFGWNLHDAYQHNPQNLRFCEPTVWKTKAGKFRVLFREDSRKNYNKFLSVSDDGIKWTEPEITDIADAPSLSFALTLGDGRVFLFGNHAGKGVRDAQGRYVDRDPLSVSVSDDGEKFHTSYSIRRGWYEPKVPNVRFRGGSAQYPNAIESDGYVYVIYSMGKENIELTRFPVPAAAAEGLSCLDLSGEIARHSVVAAGTPEVYNGHPTTILMGDNRTMYCFWPINHGGHGGPAALSEDAGRTWRRIDDRMPEGCRLMLNCPMAHRLTGPDGKDRLWSWYGFLATTREQSDAHITSKIRREAERTLEAMPSVMSEDGGKTWRAMPPLGEKFRCVLSFQGLVQLKDGSYLGVFHRGPEACVDKGPLEVLTSVTRDGGFTWSDPQVIASVPGMDLCEPWAVRSPDGRELAVVMRENTRKHASQVIFSQDEGRTWSAPRDVPKGLTGDRHQGVRLADGRLVVCFRDMEKGSPTRGHFIAWVGQYAALHGKPDAAAYHIKLFHNHSGWDCGYSGVHLLPDGEVVATTYVQYRPDKCGRSVMTTRFKPE